AFITAGPTNASAFSPDRKTLASAGQDGVRLRDIATHRATITLATGAFTSVAFSPDGRAEAGGWPCARARQNAPTRAAASLPLISDRDVEVLVQANRERVAAMIHAETPGCGHKASGRSSVRSGANR
ncbi:MAG: WD40 repeat domain-containing protein, partial [Streptomycetaceae bacterium]|nr:WD40 repeat domain-containing protein [Streptomycetaceae bacterium]